ncbi:MAG TPA: BON domain-containing protein [Candidatus Acidoferrales bacterium]|nr:BON domain-containing protein [Candidatus Acidoferrales bacterium]
MKIAGSVPLIVMLTTALIGCSAQQQQRASADANQASIVSQVVVKLVAIDVDAASNVRVSESGGVVTLSGEAHDAAERGRYVQAAQSVHGVNAVRDDLSVNPHLRGVREDSVDAALTVRVTAAIAAQSGVNVFHIAPQVHQGVVVLNGSVPSDAVRDTVVQTVRGVRGVKRVVDNLRIG